jgi:hypothetical protein
MADIEKSEAITPAPALMRSASGSVDDGKMERTEDNFEVFKKGEGNVDFRTVGWIQASVIFLKGTCACSFLVPNIKY